VTVPYVPQVRHVGQRILTAGHVVALTGNRLPLRVTATGISDWTTRITLARGDAALINSGSALLLLQTGSQGGIGRFWPSVDLGAHRTSRPLPCTAGQDRVAAIGVTFTQAAPWCVDCYNDDQSSKYKPTTSSLWETTDEGRH
jgi:hypothetical protein